MSNEEPRGLAARHAAYASWMRNDMGLKDAEVVAPEVATPTVVGVGHSPRAFAARFTGMVMAICALIALMIGARPADHGVAAGPSRVANAVGATFGTLAVSGFIAGRAIERRTRYQVWLQVENRAVQTPAVEGLLAAADRRRDAGSLDQLWIAGPAVDAGARALARDRGVRCFVREGAATREV